MKFLDSRLVRRSGIYKGMVQVEGRVEILFNIWEIDPSWDLILEVKDGASKVMIILEFLCNRRAS